jgi:hypothetical protein
MNDYSFIVDVIGQSVNRFTVKFRWDLKCIKCVV